MKIDGRRHLASLFSPTSSSFFWQIFEPWRENKKLDYLRCFPFLFRLIVFRSTFVRSKDKVLSHDYWQLLSLSRNLYWKLETVTSHETLSPSFPYEKMLIFCGRSGKSLASGVKNKSDCCRRNRLQLVNCFFCMRWSFVIVLRALLQLRWGFKGEFLFQSWR